MPITVDGVALTWLGHAGFLIEPADGKRPSCVIDPFLPQDRTVDPRPVDVALITHPHYDHLSVDDLDGFVGEATALVAVEACRKELVEAWPDHDLVFVAPGDTTEVRGVGIEAVPAYNVNKNYHPRDEGWVGYVLDVGGTRIYHAGDTDLVPAMDALDDLDVALLPVGGTYTMDATEAVKAAELLDARVCVPMHFGSVVGTPRDAERFVEALGDRGRMPEG